MNEYYEKWTLKDLLLFPLLLIEFLVFGVIDVVLWLKSKLN